MKAPLLANMTEFDRMQTRAELYQTIGYHDYEALDSSIITSTVPTGNPPVNSAE